MQQRPDHVLRNAGRMLFRLIRRERRTIGKLFRIGSAAALSRLAQLLMTIVVARQLGPGDYGVFITAVAGSLVTGMIGSLGWPLSFNRLMPELRARKEWPELRGLVLACDLAVLSGCCILSVALFSASVIVDEKTQIGLLACAILTPLYGLTILRRQQLIAVGHAGYALMLDQGLASLGVLVAVLVAPVSVNGMLIAYGLGLAGGCAIATWLYFRALPEEIRGVQRRFRTREWATASGAMLAGQSARLFLSRIDVLLIPALAGLVQAGLFGAALRVTYVLTFPQFLLQTLTAPALGEAFANRRAGQVRRVFKFSLLFAVATALPVAAGAALFPEWVLLKLFGPEFVQAAPSLVWLILAQFTISVSIPFAALLNIGGREKPFALVNAGVVISSLLAGILLIPPYGAVGAAIVSLCASLVLLASLLYIARPLLINTHWAD